MGVTDGKGSSGPRGEQDPGLALWQSYLSLVKPLWGRGKEPQVCQGAGAEFSGPVPSPEDGRRLFLEVSQATGTAHGMAQWQEHQDVSQTHRRMSRQTESGWMEGKAKGAELGGWRRWSHRWQDGQGSGLVRFAFYKAPSSCHRCGRWELGGAARGGNKRAPGVAGLPGADEGPGQGPGEHRGSPSGRIRWAHFASGIGTLCPLEPALPHRGPCPWPSTLPSTEAGQRIMSQRQVRES